MGIVAAFIFFCPEHSDASRSPCLYRHHRHPCHDAILPSCCHDYGSKSQLFSTLLPQSPPRADKLSLLRRWYVTCKTISESRKAEGNRKVDETHTGKIIEEYKIQLGGNNYVVSS